MPPLPRIAIEGHLRKPDGSPLADAIVTFTLSLDADSDLTSDTVVLAEPVSVRTDNEGLLRVQLWANDRGFQNSHYVVEAVVRGTDRDTPYKLGRMQVTEDGSTDLEQLLTEEVVRALDIDEQTLAAAVRAETAAQNARASQAAVDTATIRRQAVADAKPAFPLAPNLLADTKKFRTLCGGRANTETEIVAAHQYGSPWRAWRPPAANVEGTLEVVTLPNLAAKGIGFGGDLAKATDARFAGSDFRVVLMDVTIANNAWGGNSEQLIVLAQNSGSGLPFFTGSNKGEFKTQAACFVNVVSHSGNITLRISDRIMPGGDLRVRGNLAGDGWTYLHRAATGWGEGHQCLFDGDGSMKLALALPYVGTGDHGGAFIYAQSIGRYTHGEDRLPSGVRF